MSERLIITIDGPAASGKSTAARELARRLGLRSLNTGQMYRAVAALALERGIDPAREPELVERLAEDTAMRVDFARIPPRLHASIAGQEERELTDLLSAEAVGEYASRIAEYPGVRRALVRAQRDIGLSHPRLVSEGRDQGTVVFPDADVKFFLDASVEVRAQRRVREMLGRGVDCDPVQVAAAIAQRDQRDRQRVHGRLEAATDAIVVHADGLDVEGVADFMQRQVEEKVRPRMPR